MDQIDEALHWQNRQRFFEALASFEPQHKQETTIEHVRHALKESRLTLVLGAGVAADLGLPLWPALMAGLVRRLCVGVPPSLESEVAAVLSDFRSSPLLIARHLEMLAGFRSIFMKMLRGCLYENLVEPTNSPLLHSLASCLLLPSAPLPIRHVITYNFDNLLERYLKALDCNYRSVTSLQSYATIYGGLKIFHPHGFLPHPADDPDDRLLEEAVVFSERDYHDEYLNQGSWTSTLQMHHTMTQCCLFVGMSLSDPDIRRILDHSSRNQRPATARHVTIQKIDSSRIRNAFTERELQSLGVQVLWVNDHEEIPALIKKCCT